MSKSRITRSAEPTESGNPEIWIGEVELCGAAWTFAVLGPGDAEPEMFAYASRDAADRARAAIFTGSGRPVAIVVEHADDF